MVARTRLGPRHKREIRYVHANLVPTGLCVGKGTAAELVGFIASECDVRYRKSNLLDLALEVVVTARHASVVGVECQHRGQRNKSNKQEETFHIVECGATRL